MDNIATVVLLFLGLLYLVISPLEACMCSEEKHPQQHFCELDYGKLFKLHIYFKKLYYFLRGGGISYLFSSSL